jgi:exosome complex RNA-binding protein Rrp42 (RNase PH superfamily)
VHRCRRARECLVPPAAVARRRSLTPPSATAGLDCAPLQVWSVRCDVHILDDGGNAIDCSSLAAMTALLHFRHADVTVSGDTVTVHTLEERAPVPLSIHHTPVSVTFGIVHVHGGASVVFVDPSDREELVMDGRITISVNAHSELCGVHKLGKAASGSASTALTPRRRRHVS